MFEKICAALEIEPLAEDALGDFFRTTPWVDSNADYSRVAALGRLSVWEEPDGRTYLIVGLPDGSPVEFLQND